MQFESFNSYPQSQNSKAREFQFSWTLQRTREENLKGKFFQEKKKKLLKQRREIGIEEEEEMGN